MRQRLTKVCDKCSNYKICRGINTLLFRNSFRVESRDLLNVREHLRRDGFKFPEVQEETKCWLSNKPAVTAFYYSTLKNLTDKTLS